MLATLAVALVGLSLTTYFSVLAHVFPASEASQRPNRAHLAVFATILLAVPAAVTTAAWMLTPIPELAAVRPWLAIPVAIMAIRPWATCRHPPGTTHAP